MYRRETVAIRRAYQARALKTQPLTAEDAEDAEENQKNN
jgi:hypothetical protein